MDVLQVGTKALSTLGMLAIGDGVATAVAPRRHIHAWSFANAPRWYGRAARSVEHDRWNALAWAVGTIAIGAGLLWLAERRA